MKYKVRKKSITFSKALAKKYKKEDAVLLSKITKLEQDIYSQEKFDEYDKTKKTLTRYIITTQKV